MNTKVIFIIVVLLSALGCKDSTTGPAAGDNLLSNSTFEVNGVASLSGWTVPDASVVQFSSDIPPDGSGHSILMTAQWFAPWPSNSIYASVVPLRFNHQYRLSVFGKKHGVGGSVYAHRNRPSDSNAVELAAFRITDTAWTYYSEVITLSALETDTIFVTITGGGTEVAGGATYFNTCRFERIDSWEKTTTRQTTPPLVDAQ